MGLDASVMCRCFQDGSVEPPVPRDWLGIDEEGYLFLVEEQYTEENSEELEKWLDEACPHRNMEYACERISNWSGYRSFQSALETLGAEHFPVLMAELPMNNGGKTEPSLCAAALEELDRFMSFPEIARVPALYSGETGQLLYKYIDAYEGVFIWSGRENYEAGVDVDGFFVRTTDGQVLFRSRRFLQSCVVKRNWWFRKTRSYVWKDLNTGEEFSTLAPIGFVTANDPTRHDNPTEFYVDEELETPDDYDYAVDPLRIVFQAAIETGNPVRWC